MSEVKVEKADESPYFDKNLANELKNKMKDSDGEFFYVLNREGNRKLEGIRLSKLSQLEENLMAAAASQEFSAQKIIQKPVQNNEKDGEEIFSILFLIRKIVQNNSMDFIESRFAILGNVDAGKSTLVGVLTYGIYDNGKGTARKNVLAFPHEKESGRTSSISTQILGFDISGQPLYDNEKHPSKHRKNQSISSVTKMLTFIDLAGHEKYLKTTIGGFSGYEMTGSLIVIGANAGGIGTFNEHLGLCEAFSFPYALVFTKIDNCPKKVFENNLKIMVQFLRSNSCNKRPLKIKSLKDVVIAAKNFHSLELVPIFMVSNVTGEGIPLLLTFLNIVKSKNYKNLNNQISDDENKNPEIIAEVSDKFTVKSLKGVVVQAYVKKGEISLNSVLCIGPNRSGLYAHVEVKEIRRFNLNVNSLKTNQIGTIALRNVGSSKRMEFVAQKETVSRGMFLLNPKFVANNDPIWEFTADIKVRRHPSAIKEGYQAVMHLGHIRSCVRLMKINRHDSKTSADGPEQNDQSENIRYLKAGDSGTVVMHMLYAPAFIQVGSMMLFREQKTKAVGRILSVSSQRRLYPKERKSGHKFQITSEI